MEKRPPFDEIKSFEEFSKYYWYREELQKICREHGIDAGGMKAQLNHNIEEYFKGNVIRPEKSSQCSGHFKNSPQSTDSVPPSYHPHQFRAPGRFSAVPHDTSNILRTLQSF